MLLKCNKIIMAAIKFKFMLYIRHHGQRSREYKDVWYTGSDSEELTFVVLVPGHGQVYNTRSMK